MRTETAVDRAAVVLSLRLPRLGPTPVRAPVCSPARVAKLLAFAHQIRRGLADGTWPDPVAVARAHHLTRARVSQLLRLTRLAPDIQLAVLSLEAIDGREPPVAERWLRLVVARLDEWDEQRAAWAARATHHSPS